MAIDKNIDEKVPILSIIIPVYNADKFLDKCIKSIINQKLKTWELILIDDGSKDNSGNILDYYSEIDKRIKVRHISNKGVSNARNIGLSLAKGKYIGFVDADDWVSKNMYVKMIDLAESYEYDMVQCSYSIIDKKNTKVGEKIVEDKVYIGADETIKAYFEGNITPSVFNKIFRRSKVKDIIFDSTLSIGEDGQYIYQCSKKLIKSLSINDEMYFYYQSEGSAMRSPLSEKKFQPLYIIDKQIEDNKDKKNILLLLRKREVFTCIDLMSEILEDKTFYFKLNELEKRILNNKNYIFRDKNYNIKIKFVLVMLSISPNIFYKLYKLYLRVKQL